MRVFVPATSVDLVSDAPRMRRGWTVVAPAGVSGEDLEVLEDDAQTEAALASLVATRDAGGAPARIVLAVDIEKVDVPAGEGVLEVGVDPFDWSKVAALLVDGPEASDDVRAVVSAESQEEADEAVAALWEWALEWYDISEREDLAARLGA